MGYTPNHPNSLRPFGAGKSYRTNLRLLSILKILFPAMMGLDHWALYYSTNG